MSRRAAWIARTIRWTLICLFCLTCAAAVFSEFRVIHASERYDRPWPSQAILQRSTLSCWLYVLRPSAGNAVTSDSPLADHGFVLIRSIEPKGPDRSWIPDFRYHDFGTALHWQLTLPLWIPIVVLGIPVFGLVRRGPLTRWRRARRGLCPSCGYAVHGASTCPECGTLRTPCASSTSQPG